MEIQINTPFTGSSNPSIVVRLHEEGDAAKAVELLKEIAESDIAIRLSIATDKLNEYFG